MPADDSGISDPSVQLALWCDAGRRRQFDVQRAEQAALADRCGGVGRQLDVAVDAHRQQRMPPCRSIFVTVPTVTSSTCTREFGSIVRTSGSCAWIVYEPGPPPAVPGSGSELRPRHPQPAGDDGQPQ